LELRRHGDVRAFVVDAPLLIEAGMDAELCDAVIFVDADASIRQARTKERRGWSSEEHARREQAQDSLDLKRKRADYVVNNNSTPDALREEVARVFAKILSTCSASARP
jgi:dephospho-CoA kinase